MSFDVHISLSEQVIIRVEVVALVGMDQEYRVWTVDHIEPDGRFVLSRPTPFETTDHAAGYMDAQNRTVFDAAMQDIIGGRNENQN